jgi:hypothetical protein
MAITVKGIAAQGVAGEMAVSTTQLLRSKPEGGGDNRTVQVQGVAGAGETLIEKSGMQVDPEKRQCGQAPADRRGRRVLDLAQIALPGDRRLMVGLAQIGSERMKCWTSSR